MRCAVILSGCGVQDGSEIHEAVTLLLVLSERGHEAHCFAPDIEQTRVVDHRHGVQSQEKRNVLTESARIARGQIQPLDRLNPENFDAILLPGGLGAALNLSHFASEDDPYDVIPQLSRVLLQAHQRSRILGFMCIAPVIAAAVFGNQHVKMTIGDDHHTAQRCENRGAQHVNCDYNQACIDENLKIVSVPAYMKAKNIHECYLSAKALVEAVEGLGISGQ